ncbi:MAG: hypothetical protein HOZ81_10870 [Streptomyces sp.]|nr:hypothetical protein [Streptomyces sp.]NUS24247.1 hypothetical protein [Streptomyces sp.]
MSYFTATFFLEGKASVRGSGAPNPALYVTPSAAQGGYVTFQIDDKLPLDDQVRIVETFLSGVQRWRDQLVENAQRRRTAEDELAAAREEIARLKADRDGGAA